MIVIIIVEASKSLESHRSVNSYNIVEFIILKIKQQVPAIRLTDRIEYRYYFPTERPLLRLGRIQLVLIELSPIVIPVAFDLGNGASHKHAYASDRQCGS